MPADRRDPARRLIEWTGERLVPWTDEIQTVYEHFHRYLWAAPLVAGRRVLDLGSGEGYGTALLAEHARAAVGIDIDEQAVKHSRVNYGRANLEFRVGSILELQSLDAGSFDAVIAFEVIEHVDDHARVLDGVDHVLAPDGLFIVSTPDRRIYSEAAGYDNPFHQRELSEPEFRDLLEARFAHVALWGQRAISGSWLAARDDPAGGSFRSFFVERSGEGWETAAEPPPVYLVAVASKRPLRTPPEASVLVDGNLELVRRWEQATAEAQADRHREYVRAEHLAHDLMVTTADRDRLDRELREVLERHGELLERFDAAVSRLRRVEESTMWTLLERVRALTYRLLGGRESRRGRLLQRALRALGPRRRRC